MSTPVPCVEVPLLPSAAGPVLVRAAGEEGPRLVWGSQQQPVNAHRLFYGMGYSGLGLIVAGVWMGAIDRRAGMAVYPVAALFIAVAGFGVLVHTSWKPNERKLRHMLLAIASLALLAMSAPVVERIAREVRAGALIHRLQPLADALAADPRIREVGVVGVDWVTLNGFNGPEHGSGGTIRAQPGVLDDVLARDGITRAELAGYQAALDRARVREAVRTDGVVVFTPTGVSEVRLMYVPPGRAIPGPGVALDDHSQWRSTPIGGGWYLVLRQ